MIAFDELTPRGQARRLREVAVKAFAQYALPDPHVELVASSFNTVFRVHAEHRSYALRIAPQQRIHPLAAAEAEADWTARLAAGGVSVPQVIRTVDGAASVSVSADGVPGARECMLLDWVPGRPVPRPASARDATGLGGLSARLHTVSTAVARRPPGVVDGRSTLLFDTRIAWTNSARASARCSAMRTRGRNTASTPCGRGRCARRECCTVISR